MKSTYYLLTCLLTCCLVSNACSQTGPGKNQAAKIIFQGSTPGDGPIKTLLEIPAGSKVDFIKWNLSVDPDFSGKHNFSIDISFGEVQQNSLGFVGGGEKLSLKGEYKVSGDVYHLQSTQLSRGILLRKINDNLVHFITAQNKLMTGNAMWSYTLNRLNPVSVSSPPASPLLSSNSLDTAVKYVGKTPVHPLLLTLNGVTPARHQRIKWALTLYRDAQTHLPTTFLLRSVYVGVSDAVATKTGKWEIGKGIKSDPQATVYLLKLHEGNLALLSADDGTLFFLDDDRNLMVGNADHSYTLNKE